MADAEPGPPGPPSDATGRVPPAAGETVLLRLVPCALLAVPADGPAVGAWARPAPAALRYRCSSRRAVMVGATGVPVGSDALVDAEPVEVTVTSRRLLVAGRGGRAWSWDLDDVVEVLHGETDPGTVVRLTGGTVWAVLVPGDQADRFRAALDVVLDLAPVTAPATPATSGIAWVEAEAPAGIAGEQAATTRLDAIVEDGTPTADLRVPARTTLHPGGPAPPPPRRRLHPTPGLGDRVFRRGSLLGGLSVLAVMALVGLFLVVRAASALKVSGFSFLTTSDWQPDSHRFGIAAVLTGTVVIALVALVVAVPLATGTALFISEMAPRRLRQTFVSMVDLMAAVPSVVYGLWGFKYLQGNVVGLSRWLSTWCSWIPIFRVSGADPRNPLASASVYTASAFVAGLVVALMVIPIACSIMREVFSQAPPGEREGAYALGATRWGMIRSVVLPFGRGGMIGAVMLGLGRALGETIAVVLIISPLFKINWHILQTGANTVSSLIVLRVGDASGFGLSALMAAGLALFVLTLVVNFSAATIVSRSRSGAQSEV